MKIISSLKAGVRKSLSAPVTVREEPGHSSRPGLAVSTWRLEEFEHQTEPSSTVTGVTLGIVERTNVVIKNDTKGAL